MMLQARLSSLKYLDTRILSLASGVINLIWAVIVFFPLVLADVYPTGFLARVTLEAPHGFIAVFLLVLGVCEIHGAVANAFYPRLICSIFSTAWWAWLTAMAFVRPPNETAGLMLGVFTFFRAWTCVTINYTHPEGKHYHAAP